MVVYYYTTKVAMNLILNRKTIQNQLCYLRGAVMYSGCRYKIHVNELHYSDRANNEHFANSIEHLRDLQIDFGIFTISRIVLQPSLKLA